jgi:hypothetical protein
MIVCSNKDDSLVRNPTSIYLGFCHETAQSLNCQWIKYILLNELSRWRGIIAKSWIEFTTPKTTIILIKYYLISHGAPVINSCFSQSNLTRCFGVPWIRFFLLFTVHWSYISLRWVWELPNGPKIFMFIHTLHFSSRNQKKLDVIILAGLHVNYFVWLEV